VIAFEDPELAERLMQAIEERSGQFLLALAQMGRGSRIYLAQETINAYG
jgi:hypothetical protein